MSDPKAMHDLTELILRVLDGAASPEETQRLQETLRNDPDARQYYIEMVDICAGLHRRSFPTMVGPLGKKIGATAQVGRERKAAVKDAGGLSSLADEARRLQAKGKAAAVATSRFSLKRREASDTTSRYSAWRIAAIFVFIASAVMTLTSPTWLSWWRSTPVATLADAVDAQWDGPEIRLDVGDRLPYGPLFLKAGYASIRLDNGVKLVVQGPAHFSVDSLKLAHLDEGKITADVPHAASGYSVKIPSGMVTDIGTTFGVTAFANSESTVQVLKGSVQAQLFAADGKQKDQVVLTEDHAVALSPITGAVASVPIEADAYATDIRHLPPALEQQRLASFRQWQRLSAELRSDKSLVAYYGFDNEDKSLGQLLNSAAATLGKNNGQIENATWDEGRFPGKRALRFNGETSRVKVNIPGQMQHMTVAMWVRIDSWKTTGLLMSDDWNKSSEMAFQIDQDRGLWNGIYVSGAGGGGGNPFGPRTVLPESVTGKWIHLAATWDAPATTVAVYQNGVELDRQTKAPMPPICIGSALIGSWDPKTWNYGHTTGDFQRGLNGRIDEVAIFSRVLSDTEIKAMYETGAP
jgi:hypothetical protein